MRAVRIPSRRSTTLCVAVVLVATFALADVASADDVSPINPNNRPTALPGAVNGVVPSSRLVTVARNCVAAREAGPSLARIFAMAREINIGLGAEQCYRPLSDEVRFANQANQPGNNPACVATVGTAPNGTPVGRSYHGWGKAADLTDAGRSLTFSSPGYFFMKQVAGSLGWNHPAFAEPGGSSCPEAWHWEWVGDGGNLGASPRRGDAIALLPSADDHGYAVVNGLGGLLAHGSFVNRGAAGSIPIAWVMVGAANTRNRGGYWMVGADGGVFSFGNAQFYGSTANFRLAQPVNGMASTRSGHGYWLLAWDGGIFSFGDARFFGSTGAMRLNSPVDAMAATPSGNGYWLVAADGGVFSFGDAKFKGSMGGQKIVSPVVGIASTPTGKGYWMVASDGGVFSFGDAHFYGSLAGTGPPAPIISITPTKTGHGYWLELADGEVLGFGDARDS
jgi:hypothetical protein